jgi:hypothetical protein
MLQSPIFYYRVTNSFSTEGLHKGFWWGDMKERDNLEDLDVNGNIILKFSSRSGWGGMDWIDLAQNRDRR